MARILGLENISWWALVTSSCLILSRLLASAISVALLQMTRARLASPDRLVTFLATSWMASYWKMVRPSSLLPTLFIIILSGRSFVFAMAIMISLLSGLEVHSKAERSIRTQFGPI